MDKIMILMIIVLLAVLAKGMKQDFFSPAVINIYWNGFFLIGAVVIFGTGIEWNYAGIYWILLSCGSFFVGQICGSRIKIGTVVKSKKHMGNYITIILVLLIMVSLINPYIYVKNFGYSIFDLVDFNKLQELNAAIAYDRYIGHQVQVSATQTLISVIMYFSAIVGGYCFNYQKRKIEKLLCIAVIFPMMLLTVISNAKLGVIADVFLWGTGWILSYLNTRGEKSVLTKKMVLLGGILLIGGIVFFDFAMLLRYGGINVETQMIANQKLQEYIYGQIQAFTIWFSNINVEEYTFGGNTYMFIPNWLGVSQKIQGVYEAIPETGTNIFTINRGIIEDFGTFGGLIYWIVLGIIGGVAYKKVKSMSKNCIVEILLLGSIYFLILHGFMISPWVYSSYVLAFAGFGILLVLLKVFDFSFTR